MAGRINMGRSNYKIFSQGKIGNVVLSNRLVRSATGDPSILTSRKMTDEVLNLYRELAIGGIGLIITGGLPVYREKLPGEDSSRSMYTYNDLQVEGIDQLTDVVHSSRLDCKIVAQLETDYLNAGPSDISSPFSRERIRPLAIEEIRSVIDRFVEAIVRMKEAGFDGVQLNGAHGGLLSCFLSPYTNRRNDKYGGSTRNRARIVKEIVSGAREKVGDWPILIKVNCTDYMEGGIDFDNFPELAEEIEALGIDALEVSGGMWDCLIRSEEELGFRPVPAPDAHTRIGRPEKQSYFLKYAERLNLNIPVILVGGNRNIERLEEIVRQGKVDFIALCRPLIREPDLPNRWLQSRGKNAAQCISCNSCIYNMSVHPGRLEPGPVTCLARQDKQQHKLAQEWLSSWVDKNVVR
jgi:2,4-dienoyl-CoA reductase-like NADH-dependent reductase (Old Yellow Enzyme family)